MAISSSNSKPKYRFDTELLITEIEQRPCIWDTSSEEYKNRDTKNKAWNEVAETLLQDYFVNLDETKQKEAIKMMQQRWKSARDAYRRDRSKLSTTLSDQEATTYKTYIYFENLHFLNKTIDLNETDTKFHLFESQDPLYESVYEEERVFTKPIKRRKKQDSNEKLMEFINISKPNEENGNRAFLESLLPTLDTFDEEKSLQFRAEVLRIMMELKNVPTFSQMCNARNNFQVQEISNQKPILYPQYDENGASSPQ